METKSEFRCEVKTQPDLVVTDCTGATPLQLLDNNHKCFLSKEIYWLRHKNILENKTHLVYFYHSQLELLKGGGGGGFYNP